MSSSSFKGSEILSESKKSKPVKLLRSQTAKQAARAIRSKYGSISKDDRYYHRGGGVWQRYSPARDKKSTSPRARTQKPKNYSKVAHKIDVRGVDTKQAGKKARTARKTARKTKKSTPRVTIPKPTQQKKYAGFLIGGDTYTAKREIKAMGGKWKPDLKAWVVPSNKANATSISSMKKARKINVSAYKTDVNPFKRLNAAEKLAIRESKLLKKAERYESKASKKSAESKTRLDSAHKKASAIPFGQPILVGHHSEGRDRRYRASIQSDYSKGFAAMKEAEHAGTKAAGTRSFTEKYIKDPTAIKGRIKKLEAELRKQERRLEQNKTMLSAYKKVKGKSSYNQRTVDRCKAGLEDAKRRIPDIKEDIKSLKALLPKTASAVSAGVTMKEFTGARLKKALGVTTASKQYHNKSLRGGNFGILLRTNKTWYDITGQHDPDGVIRTLSIINTQTTKGYYPTSINTKTFGGAMSDIKKYMKTAESKL